MIWTLVTYGPPVSVALLVCSAVVLWLMREKKVNE